MFLSNACDGSTIWQRGILRRTAHVLSHRQGVWCLPRQPSPERRGVCNRRLCPGWAAGKGQPPFPSHDGGGLGRCL